MNHGASMDISFVLTVEILYNIYVDIKQLEEFKLTIRLPKTKTQAKRMGIIGKYKTNLINKMANPTYKPKQFNSIRMFTVDDVNKIRRMYEDGHANVSDISRMYCCSLFAIRNVIRYRTYIIDTSEKSLIEMQDDGEILPDYRI